MAAPTQNDGFLKQTFENYVVRNLRFDKFNTQDKPVLVTGYKSDVNQNEPNIIQKGKELKSVQFMECTLDRIPTALLERSELEALHFIDCVFLKKLGSDEVVVDDTFESLRHLKKLRKLVVEGRTTKLSYFPQSLSKLTTLEELHLVGHEISDLPESMSHLEHLQVLDVSECLLSAFPDVVCELTTLVSLDLHSNRIKSLPDSAKKLVNLQRMDLRRCGFEQYPEIVLEMPSLTEVVVYEGDRADGFPRQLNKLKTITRLDVSNQYLKVCPDIVGKLVQLVELNLERNRDLSSLPDSLAQLTSLMRLNLAGCNLSRYPEVVSELTALQELNLSWNEELKSVSTSVVQLRNLRTLDITGCGIKEYPEVFFDMPWLTCVHFKVYSGKPQELFALPISELTNTKTIDLSGGNLLILPNFLFKLTSLEELNLSGMKVYDDDVLSPLTEIRALQKLTLKGSSLPYFPDVLCRLTTLRELHVNQNYKVKELPSALTQLVNLKVLDISFCGLDSFPEVVCRLQALQKLKIYGNLIKSVPKSVEKLQNLQTLHLGNCGLSAFPDIICKLPCLESLSLHGNLIDEISESVIRTWHELSLPAMENLRNAQDIAGLQKPPFAIFQKGSKACLEYYNSVKASSIVKQSLLSVQVLGKTGAGKSSLIRTLKEGKPHLVEAADRTVVADTVEIQHDNTLLQVTDFGGHDIYELTCPLFLRASNNITFIAVKLCEYCEENHDELVTKWLATALTSMKNGNVCIAATQVDLCDEDKAQRMMELLKVKVLTWMDEEIKYIQKLNSPSDNSEPRHLIKKDCIAFLMTSSKTMKGMEDLKAYLSQKADGSKLALPTHWGKMYRKLLNKQDEEERYLKLEEVYSMFKKSLPLARKMALIGGQDDFELCLHLLHDMGMLLWYHENASLKDVVFHKIPFIVTVLKCLFRHDLCQYLSFDYEKHGKFIGTEVQFETDMKQFCQTGILSQKLLKCVWDPIHLQEEDFDKLVQILRNLDLCYPESEETKTKENREVLRFPWFVQGDDKEGILDKKWPKLLPSGTIQYSLIYSFYHKIPVPLFERLCVRMHSHLVSGGHTRKDWRDAVYVEQDDVQILLQRRPDYSEPSVEIHLRCAFSHLLKLKRLLFVLYNDLETLCSELPGIVVNAYFLCPHCLLSSHENPKRKHIKQLPESHPLDWVPCDPNDMESEKLPAAMIFLGLFGKSKIVLCLYDNKIRLKISHG